jgi:hypothetical protein
LDVRTFFILITGYIFAVSKWRCSSAETGTAVPELTGRWQYKFYHLLFKVLFAIIISYKCHQMAGTGKRAFP